MTARGALDYWTVLGALAASDFMDTVRQSLVKWIHFDSLGEVKEFVLLFMVSYAPELCVRLTGSRNRNRGYLSSLTDMIVAECQLSRLGPRPRAHPSLPSLGSATGLCRQLRYCHALYFALPTNRFAT